VFTGIITDMGRVRAVESNGDTRFTIDTAYGLSEIDIGASIACAGVCLTVVDKSPGVDSASSFSVTASAETLSKTTLGDWTEGTHVNLEKSLRVGDELGGHIVTGHVDGTVTIVSAVQEGDSVRFVFRIEDALRRFVAPKGSIALDGVSLTVNEVEGDTFGVNIIPHTRAVTTFGEAARGDRANLEIDVLARYVARLAEDG
jgi:riboflavin synthase